MATISFQCYACQQVLKVGGEKAGKRGKCPKCGTMLTIPVGSSAAPAPPPPPAAAPPPLPQAPQPKAPAAQYAPGAPPAQGPLRAELVEDDADFPPPPPRRRASEDAEVYEAEEVDVRAPAAGGAWKHVRLGLLLVFIGFCVIAGAFALQLIGYLLFTINTIQALSGRPSGGMGAPAFAILWRIAEVIGVCGTLTAVAGYVFCILGPKQRGALPLAITTVSVTGVYLLLTVIFKLPFLFSQGFGLFGGRGVALTWFMQVGIQLLFCAELVLFPLYLRAVGYLRNRPRHASSCMVPLFLAAGYGVLRLIAWVLGYVVIRSESEPSRGLIWITILLLWLGSIAFVVHLIFYLLLLWRSRALTNR